MDKLQMKGSYLNYCEHIKMTIEMKNKEQYNYGKLMYFSRN